MKDATYYDSIFRGYDQGTIDGIAARMIPAVNLVVGDSVLDLGCGMGQCANLIPTCLPGQTGAGRDGRSYHGVDFSLYAVQYAREHWQQNGATFEYADFLSWHSDERFDTVLLLEVLEHLDDPSALAELALSLAEKRIVVTVPISMPDPGHVQADWCKEDLERLFGSLTTFTKMGSRWLATWDRDPREQTVSVCMIVWNEEEALLTALESTRGLADEVIVVDTGSTDRTVEIARAFGCRVFTGSDRMDKSAARNRAQDEATGDWVVVLDADERIAEPERLREFLQTTGASGLHVRETYLSAPAPACAGRRAPVGGQAGVDAGGEPDMAFSQLRCWRRGTFHYRYRAHELPLPAEGDAQSAMLTDFVWEHRPDRARDKWKLRYTLDRLLLDVEEHPDDLRPLFYLARQYMYLKDWKQAIGMFREYVSRGATNDAGEAWYCLAICYAATGDVHGQMAALHQACAIQPTSRQFWGTLAVKLWEQGFREVAIGLMQMVVGLPMRPAAKVQYPWHGGQPEALLARWRECVTERKTESS